MQTVRSRLRVSMALAIGLAIILSGTAVGTLLVVSRVGESMRREAIEKNRLIARTMANDISTFLDAYSASLRLLGNPAFRNQHGVDGVARDFPAFDSVFTVDTAGFVEYASERSKERLFDVSMRDFFRETTGVEGVYLSSTFIGEGSYSPTAVLAASSAHGLAVGYLNLAQLSVFVMSLPVYGGETVAVVDRLGYYVAHSDHQRVKQRESVATEDWFMLASDPVSQESSSWLMVDRPSGETELVCWAPVNSDSGWTVMVVSPSSRVFAVADYFASALLMTFALTGVFVFSVVAYILWAFDRDIRSLRAHTTAIAAGNYDANLGYNGFADLRPLADDFGKAVQAIQEREEQLKDNRHRLESLLDFMPVPVISIAPDNSIAVYNKAMTELVGWTIDEVRDVEGWWRRVYPDQEYRNTVQEHWHGYLSHLRADGERLPSFEGRLACKDGSTKAVIGDASIIGNDTVATFTNVSAARESEARMAANLAEKEVLLKEIHHRVKNNLQLIVSLLTLDANAPGGNAAIFADSIDRIRVMATIHELLYESRNFARIDLAEYIGTIVEWILSSYAYGARNPRLKLELEPIHLDIDAAVPCGLIINELFTNAIKYAFDENTREPEIFTGATLSPDGFVTLCIADNGKGLPESIDPERVDSLGLQLIVSLTAQLHGEWRISREGGTTWTIRFPHKDTAAALEHEPT
ncbi:MAG: hypothetical protein JXM71_07600 [Spirochaetales bacterium]|nr:hypothetical protein [Spirochaetales bacterium]